MKFKIDCDIEIEQMVDWLKEHNYAEVVRYKDCKWWNEIGCAINIVDDSDKPKAYDFCSYGERRVDNRKID
jgi:hypothetical protein